MNNDNDNDDNDKMNNDNDNDKMNNDDDKMNNDDDDNDNDKMNKVSNILLGLPRNGNLEIMVNHGYLLMILILLIKFGNMFLFLLLVNIKLFLKNRDIYTHLLIMEVLGIK